jgi:hypothetical protein
MYINRRAPSFLHLVLRLGRPLNGNSLRYHLSSRLGPDFAYKKSLIKGNFSMIIPNR